MISEAEKLQMLQELRRQLTEMESPPAEIIEILDGDGTPDEKVAQIEKIVGAADATGSIVDQWEDLLQPDVDRLQAEVMGSQFLGVVRRQTTDPDGDEVEMLRAIVADAEQLGGPAALAMIRVLSKMGPKDLEPEAAAAGDRLVAGGLADPPWVEGLGEPEFVTAHAYGDILDMQLAVAPVFRYGRDQHVLSVLIDRGLGGGVKDCWVTDDVAGVRAGSQQAGKDPDTWYQEMDLDETCQVLTDALRIEPCPEQPEQIEDVALNLALVEQRLLVLQAARAARDEAGDH